MFKIYFNFKIGHQIFIGFGFVIKSKSKYQYNLRGGFNEYSYFYAWMDTLILTAGSKFEGST